MHILPEKDGSSNVDNYLRYTDVQKIYNNQITNAPADDSYNLRANFKNYVKTILSLK